MTSASVLIGNSIKKLTVKLKKAGNPTGPINVVVRKGTGDSDSNHIWNYRCSYSYNCRPDIYPRVTSISYICSK